MILNDLGLIIPTEPHNTIQAAITAASNAPGFAVWIPAYYTGPDTYTNPNNVAIYDQRASGTIYAKNLNSSGTVTAATATITGNVSASTFNSIIRAVGAAAAAPITAAAGGTFVTTLNLPGNSAVEQIPFTVKASGLISLGAGTYTATVQPLLYASTTPGFTAAAANAVYSVAAINVTVATAAVKAVPFLAQVTMWGDSTSGLTMGTIYGGLNNGAAQLATVGTILNAPTAVAFTAAVPIQFAAAVTLTNSAATSVISLGGLFLEV